MFYPSVLWLYNDVYHVVSVFLLFPVFRSLPYVMLFHIFLFLGSVISFSHSFRSGLQVLSGTNIQPALIVLSVIWPSVERLATPCLRQMRYCRSTVHGSFKDFPLPKPPTIDCKIECYSFSVSIFTS